MSKLYWHADIPVAVVDEAVNAAPSYGYAWLGISGSLPPAIVDATQTLGIDPLRTTRSECARPRRTPEWMFCLGVAMAQQSLVVRVTQLALRCGTVAALDRARLQRVLTDISGGLQLARPLQAAIVRLAEAARVVRPLASLDRAFSRAHRSVAELERQLPVTTKPSSPGPPREQVRRIAPQDVHGHRHGVVNRSPPLAHDHVHPRARRCRAATTVRRTKDCGCG